MKTLAMALFAVILVVPASSQKKAPQKPTNPNTEFARHFSAQIDITNKALAKVVNMPCDTATPVYNSNVLDLFNDVKTLGDLTENLPDSQDAIVQVRELESFYGLTYIVRTFVQAHESKCNPSEPETQSNTESKN